MALEAPSPRALGGRNTVDSYVVHVAVTGRVTVFDIAENRLEGHDRSGLQLPLMAQRRIEKTKGESTLVGGHPLDR